MLSVKELPSLVFVEFVGDVGSAVVEMDVGADVLNAESSSAF